MPSTIFDQYKDAMSRYRAAAKKTVDEFDSIDEYDKYKALIDNAESEVWNAGISGGLAVLGGLEDITSNALTASHINDTPHYDWQINQLSQIGNRNYNTYDDIVQDYSLASITPNVDFDTVRGMSTGQKIGSVANSTLTGVSTGLTVGGIGGALAGAVVGLGGGLAGVLAGDANARLRIDELNTNAKIAQNKAMKNLFGATERLTDYNFRQAVSHIAKDGGKIKRKQMSIEEFAQMALSKPRMREHTVNTGIVREHCNGGTMIRFKK